MHKENRHFIHSDYYYKGSLEFFHLTSINNLWSILNSRAFRLYNLNSSKDYEEYSHAAKILNLSQDRIEHGKKYSYTFSFCPLTELQNKTVWQQYGNSFKGAAIVFSIENDPAEWVNFHLSDIKYDQPKSFVSYQQRVKEIENQYKGIHLDCDLSQFICFHKTAKWKGEKEVRIATYFPYTKIEEYWKYSKSEFRIEEGRNRITNYIEIPLWVDNSSDLIKSYISPELDRTQNLPTNYFTLYRN